MLSAYRRHGLVVALALVAGLASLMARPQPQAAALPALAGLMSGTGWQVIATYKPGAWPGMVWGQWRLRDAQGTEAALYLGATATVQKMVHWNGELAYEGAGYQVLQRRLATIRLRGGTAAPIGVAVVQRLRDRQLIASAVVGPDGITAHSTDDLLRTAGDILRGVTGPYYLVRVSLPAGGNAGRTGDPAALAVAAHLLSPVLSTLSADARTPR